MTAEIEAWMAYQLAMGRQPLKMNEAELQAHLFAAGFHRGAKFGRSQRDELLKAAEEVLPWIRDDNLWETRNYAENPYCPYCSDLFGEKYRYDDQPEHHPDCPGVRRWALLRDAIERARR